MKEGTEEDETVRWGKEEGKRQGQDTHTYMHTMYKYYYEAWKEEGMAGRKKHGRRKGRGMAGRKKEGRVSVCA